ncbi:MAG: carotenoid biosynthesis protein [Gaiellales bacterium]
MPRVRPSAAIALVLFAVLVVTQLVYPQVPDRWVMPMTALTVGLFLGASLAAAWCRSGPRYAGGLAGLAFAVGLGSEIVGVHTGIPFSTYAYTDALQPQLAGVPIVIPLAWAMMAYPAWRIGQIVGTTPLTRALVAAGALTAWDVALDPQMVGLGIWTWPNGGAYHGIPLVNFLGWFAVGFALFGWWALVEGDRTHPGDDVVADVLGPALYVWTWIGETVAHALFFEGAGVAAASFLAMGAFAVPALLRLRVLERWR